LVVEVVVEEHSNLVCKLGSMLLDILVDMVGEL